MMRRLKLRGIAFLVALLAAGTAGIIAQTAEAERLDEASPSLGAQEAPSALRPARPVEEEAPPPARLVDGTPASTDAPVRVVPINRDQKEVPAPQPVANGKPATASAIDSSVQPKRENMTVQLDLATVLKVPVETSTIVVGNPIIADTTVQNSGILVITGKSYGTTNIMALNAQGELLREIIVDVSASATPRAMTVQRGMDRETWSCAPRCQRTVTLGDSDGYFGSFSSQITSRNGLSQGPAAAGQGPR
jgi:hypothetical protein